MIEINGLDLPTYRGITLKLTCASCPEQYDAYKDGKLVGYLRVRHGSFTVRCPDVDGVIVYHSGAKNGGNLGDTERYGKLMSALKAIHCWIVRESIRDNVQYIATALLEQTVSREYAKLIWDEICDEVLDDIIDTSGAVDEIDFSDGDVRFAIGRSILRYVRVV